MTPRLFGIVATRSPVVAILRRGPSDWSQVSRWDPDTGTFEPGAWIHSNIYPQRCDLSPDGQWLAYFTLRTRAAWSAGPTYIAISRLPWLTALAAWGTCGTWTSGVHFVENRRIWEVGDPAEGDIEPLRQRYRLGLELTRPLHKADGPGLLCRIPIGTAVMGGDQVHDHRWRSATAARWCPMGGLGRHRTIARGHDRGATRSAFGTVGSQAFKMANRPGRPAPEPGAATRHCASLGPMTNRDRDRFDEIAHPRNR